MDTPKKEAAVANTTSLIFLAKIDAYYLAKNIFPYIFVPKEVKNEILRKKSPETTVVEQEFSSFLQEVSVKELKEMPLDEGEKAALSYCLEKKINIFISDDLKARKYAHVLGIKAVGVLGILLINLKTKAITKKDFLSLLQRLIDNNYYISPQLYAELMKEIQSLT